MGEVLEAATIGFNPAEDIRDKDHPVGLKVCP
jgi:hypothetical protein